MFEAIMELTKVVTGDGSLTFYNGAYGETYHSISGAEEEAIKKYSEACHEQLQRNIRILEVCFGLGYNTAAELDRAQGTIEIVGLENDEVILQKIQELSPRFETYSLIKQCAQKKGRAITEKKVTLKILFGDARETIKQLNKDYFDVVFFDPFSPKKCPELWTEEFFKEVCRVMKKGGVLTTYSCAAAVRENMRKAAFAVKDGPCVGRNAPGTIAVKK